jgi:hypothetical protein
MIDVQTLQLDSRHKQILWAIAMGLVEYRPDGWWIGSLQLEASAVKDLWRHDLIVSPIFGIELTELGKTYL